MEKRYYSLTSLEQEVAGYERRFGLPSERFYDAYRADRLPPSIPRFEAFCWADTLAELARLRAACATPA